MSNFITPNRTTTIPIISSAGSYVTVGVAPNGSVARGNRIRNTVTRKKVRKERVRDTITVTRRVVVEQGAEASAMTLFATSNLLVPEIVEMAFTGILEVTIFGGTGNNLRVNNPFINAASPVTVISTTTGDDVEDMNDALITDNGFFVIPSPQITGLGVITIRVEA